VSDERLDAGLLAGVVVVSAALVWSVATPMPHNGGDNAGYIALAHGLLTRGAYVEVFDPEGLPHTKYPPVFPGLLALLIAAGARTWAALKLSAAIPTVASAVLTYLWARPRLGLPGAFAAAVLFSVSAGVVYYSRWILSDPLFLSFTLLALWAADQASRASPDGPDDRPAVRARWLGLAVAATGLAFFTRSAGLPLVLALITWLAWERRWRGLLVSGVVLGVPLLAWMVRGRGEGVAQYGSEFWLVDPYNPGLGTVGWMGLLARAADNFVTYALQHVPTGVVGGVGGAGQAVLGVALTTTALVGWALRVRARPGVAEIFFPLYGGLIILWPAVWGGDRFALPLLPLIFVYGAGAFSALGGRLAPPLRALAPGLAFAALFVTAGVDWAGQVPEKRLCADAVRASGPWGCYPRSVAYFMAAATWSSSALPEGAPVLTRKPRLFYIESGHPSRAFAFSDDPDTQLALADRLGARYVLIDRWDGLAARYVGGAVRKRPDAFCWMAGFGPAEEGGAQLLGILAPQGRRVGASADRDVALVRCPDSYFRDGIRDREVDYSPSDAIRLLDEPGS
jgi:4-amino-4-deoxy-L-arabinose transferase-like glycosyltransferase